MNGGLCLVVTATATYAAGSRGGTMRLLSLRLDGVRPLGQIALEDEALVWAWLTAEPR